MKKINLIITPLFLLLGLSALSQKTISDNSPSANFQKGLDLYRDGKYGAAQKQFEKVMQFSETQPETNQKGFEKDAGFYSALCALNLYHSDAENLFLDYIKNYPDDPNNSLAYLNLSRLYYRQDRYTDVIRCFQNIDIYNLTNIELSELYFKVGYSYFKKRDYQNANRAFFEIKDMPNKYAYPANYYYGYSAYESGNYSEALPCFLKIKDAEAYSTVIPYYICQIYYLQKDYRKLISYGTEALLIPQLTNETRINQLIAQAYYEEGNYSMAAKYLEDFISKEKNITPNDIYQFGFVLYKNENYKKAVLAFEQVSENKDTIAQNALYFLADCYLKQGQKRSARLAFSKASEMNFDLLVKENASFNYGKLSYELDYHQVAVKSMQDFLTQFPDGKNADEAKEIVSNIFLSTKNYQEALPLLASIKKRTPKIDEAHQKVAFYRGVELYNKRKFDDAIKLFDLSLKFKKDQNIVASAHFWKAESLYKLNDFDNSIESYYDYFSTTGIEKHPNYQIAHYNIAYNFFNKENYEKALKYYKEYIWDAENDQAPKNQDPLVARDNIKADAVMRSGDCSFTLKKYDDAISYYDEVVSKNSAGTDYALFQKGTILGLQNQQEGKIETMYRVLNRHPESPYVDDALFEIGNTYMTAGNNELAVKEFTNIIKNYPNSSYIKNCLLTLGLINYNTGNDKQALESYKEVVELYPATKESKEAINGIKNIYVAMGDVEKFIKYVQDSVPSASIGLAEQDSLTYEAAELRYMKGECSKSIYDFTNYLTKFPEGIFATNAHFYKAECEYNSGQHKNALEDYRYVTTKPRNTFTEKSLYRTAGINYAFNNYLDALLDYENLEQIAEYKKNVVEARIGKMKSHYNLGNYQLSILNANKVIMYSKSSEEDIIEAHHFLGKSAFALDSMTIAQKEFEITKTAASEVGAEAYYFLALIEYKKGNYERSKEIVFELNSKLPPSDYWIAKGFILLAMNYVKQDDFFQARHTLQSILENYEAKDDIIETARLKLDEANALEGKKLEEIKNKKESNEEVIELPEPDTMDIETENIKQTEFGLNNRDEE